jgi:hypothetical protein
MISVSVMVAARQSSRASVPALQAALDDLRARALFHLPEVVVEERLSDLFERERARFLEAVNNRRPQVGPLIATLSASPRLEVPA